MNSATIQKLMRMVGLTKFIEFARTRQCVKLREFHEFSGDRDDLVANVVACPGGGALLMGKSVFELYAADEFLLLEAITQEDVRVLNTLIDADHWHTVND
jgi:hypothetical protein